MIQVRHHDPQRPAGRPAQFIEQVQKGHGVGPTGDGHHNDAVGRNQSMIVKDSGQAAQEIALLTRNTVRAGMQSVPNFPFSEGYLP